MAKKNAQNSGTIKHRSDGRWEARFSCKDELGQPKRGSLRPNPEGVPPKADRHAKGNRRWNLSESAKALGWGQNWGQLKRQKHRQEHNPVKKTA